MEYLYYTIIVLVAVATTTYAGYGLWFVLLYVKNYLYTFGRSLIINDKTYTSESGKGKIPMALIEYVEFAWIFGLVLISLSVLFAKAADMYLIQTNFSEKYTRFLWGYIIGSVILYGIAKLLHFVDQTLLIYYFVSGILAGGIFGFVLRKVENKQRKG